MKKKLNKTFDINNILKKLEIFEMIALMNGVDCFIDYDYIIDEGLININLKYKNEYQPEDDYYFSICVSSFDSENTFINKIVNFYRESSDMNSINRSIRRTIY